MKKLDFETAKSKNSSPFSLDPTNSPLHTASQLEEQVSLGLKPETGIIAVTDKLTV